jgi:hypothetical protein
MEEDLVNAVPIVDYLVLGDDPHLVTKECTSCKARFFDRRNACASRPRRPTTRQPCPSRGTLGALAIGGAVELGVSAISV